MSRRDLLVTAIAAMALVLCSANPSMAQKKKQPQASSDGYKLCCEKALGRYFVHDGKAHCWASEEQMQNLHQCSQQRGIRVISGGQITM